MATPSVNSPQPLAEPAVPLLICHVDDTADYRFLVEAILKKYLSTCRLRSFADGQTFLEELPGMGEKPNLIILDQHMPSWNGYQTLLALKSHLDYHSIPVVMMSADSSHSEVSSFYQAGAATFLAKSTDFNVLKETLLAACQYATKPR